MFLFGVSVVGRLALGVYDRMLFLTSRGGAWPRTALSQPHIFQGLTLLSNLAVFHYNKITRKS